MSLFLNKITMGIVGDRGEISKTSPMPVNDVTISTDIVQKTGEAVSIAAGAAGTAVAVVVDKAPIYNSTGVRVGHKEDSSFSFVTGTCLTTEVDPLNVTGDGSLVPKGGGLYVLLDRLEAAHVTAANKLAQVTSGFSNGQFVVDYENGIVYGVKATTGTSDTVTYKTRALTIVAVGTGGAVSALVDDAAFGIGSSLVTPAGFVADETSTDSVNEGDAGAARMTLNRKQITASEHIDDAELLGGAYSTVIGARADETATDSVDEGDSGYLRMTLDRKLIVATHTNYTASTLATLTNIAANTTAYLYIDMQTYKYFGLQCETSGTTPTDTLTLTIEASWQDDGTAAASCTYQDVTNDWFGVASVVDADVTFEKDTPCTARHVRLKYVTSNTGGNDCDLSVYERRSY